MSNLKPVFWNVYLPLSAGPRAAGAWPSGQVSAPGSANHLVVLLFITALVGTTPSVTVTIQTSPDDATWTTVATGAAVTTVATVGSAPLLTGFVGSDEYGQIVATVGGTASPTATFSLAALVLE